MGLEYVPEGDLYEVLGVRPDATTDEIKLAHRRLIRVHHPDTGGDDAIASALNFARDVLVDSVERHRYDELRSAYLAMHRPYAPSTMPYASPANAPRPSGVAMELLADDIKDALRTRAWFRALGLAFIGRVVDKVVDDATARNPLARSALDALADWMRHERIDGERQERRARIQRRLTGRLNKRVKSGRAAARKQVRRIPQR